MLQNIHDRAKGWLMTVIVVLISVPFALWGVNEYFAASSKIIVAEVNGQDIELPEFQRRYQQYRQQVQSMFGKLGLDTLSDEAMKRQALDQVVDTELKQQLGERSGMRTGDALISKTIAELEPFQEDGKFSQALYERRLRTNNLSPAAFEEQLRRDLLNEQLQRAISDSAFTTKQEVDWTLKVEGEKRSITFTTIAAEPLKADVPVSAEEVEKYYRDNQDRFMSEETVAISYVELSVDELAKPIHPDEAALRKRYESHLDDYGAPEQRSAHHVLIKVAKEANEKVVAKARKQAEDLTQRAKAGESFEDLASKYSEDTGSKAQKGDLGMFSRGVMVGPFDEAVFNMKPGEISTPVRTDFGFHVIRLDAIEPAKTKPFEEVRQEVETTLKREQAERAFFDKSEQLATLSFEHPDTLEPVAEGLGVPLQETPAFPRGGGTGIAANDKVIQAAFSTEVLEEGHNSEPTELGENHVVVLRLKRHKPAEIRKLDAARNDIIATLKSERARAQIQERGAALLKRLKDGEDRAKLGIEEKLTWTEKSGLARNAAEPDRAIVREAFRLARPEGEKPRYAGVELVNGDYGLFALIKVEEADPAKSTEQQLKEVGDRLARTAQTQDWQGFISTLRERAKIDLYTDKL